MSRGICSNCGRERWLGGKDKQCKPCAYPVSVCSRCKITRKIWVDDLCSVCYEDRQVRKALENWETHWKCPFLYNTQLMGLFLSYVRRYNLKYRHLRHTKTLAHWFNDKEWSAITSWNQIYQIRKEYPLADTTRSEKGCAWLKIGLMLHEVGVLRPRAVDREYQIQSRILLFVPESQRYVSLFIEILLKSNHSEGTCLNYLDILHSLEAWVHSKYPMTPLTAVSNPLFTEYLKDISCRPSTRTSSIRKTLNCSRRFYQFLLGQRLIIANPTEGLVASREQLQLTVCSEGQIRKLTSYVKNPATDSQLAFLLSLILFYGWGTEDLAFATLFAENQNTLNVIHHRRPRTKGRRFFNRPQKLTLPKTPRWYFNLQKRFYAKWSNAYQNAKKTFPNQPLILLQRGNHTRSVSSNYVNTLLELATAEAVGVKIPIRVLRQTCGHIYSYRGDASMLANLGWSPEFAFQYTWLPRIYYSQAQKKPESPTEFRSH